jgi:CNT family concentrative nucleoside transporter
MAGGMATIAGGVLAAYVGFLGGDDPVEQLYFAKHLLAASVMSAPAAIVAAKMLLPETEQFNSELKIPKERIGTNALEAVTNGTTDGVKLAVNVAAMLLVFIAMVAMCNFILKDLIGEFTGINEVIAANSDTYTQLSFEFILGNLFAPVAWMLGVCWQDAMLVGQLMGEKTVINEFYAYTTLGNLKMAKAFAEEKSVIIATYILCGFSNIASIGIQIGGIGALAPSKKPQLAQLGVKALIAGTMACLFTAVIVGMLM